MVKKYKPSYFMLVLHTINTGTDESLDVAYSTKRNSSTSFVTNCFVTSTSKLTGEKNVKTCYYYLQHLLCFVEN